MNVAYLCADFGIPIQGYKGASVHVREMVGALMAQGHDVHVFSPSAGAGNTLTAPLHEIGSAAVPAAARLARAAFWLSGPWHDAGPRLGKETRDLAYNLTFYRGA